MNMLVSSSRVESEVGSNILHFFENVDEKSKQRQLDGKIAKLRATRNRLKKRAELLKEQLELDDFGPQGPRLLSEINNEVGLVSKPPLPDPSGKMTAFGNVLNLDALQLCHRARISHRDAGKVTFEFLPNVGGDFLEHQYDVTVGKVDAGKLALLAANLPSDIDLKPKNFDFVRMKKAKKFYRPKRDAPVIPVEMVAEEILPKMDRFVATVKDHIDAYVSRSHQISQLKSNFRYGEVFNVRHSEDLTNVKFSIALNDVDDDTKSQMSLMVALTYEPHERRPAHGNLKIKIDSEKDELVDDEALESLRSQCAEFYKHPLFEAVQIGFYVD